MFFVVVIKDSSKQTDDSFSDELGFFSSLILYKMG